MISFTWINNLWAFLTSPLQQTNIYKLRNGYVLVVVWNALERSAYSIDYPLYRMDRRHWLSIAQGCTSISQSLLMLFTIIICMWSNPCV